MSENVTKKKKYYTLHWREKKQPDNCDQIRGRYSHDTAEQILSKANKDYPRFQHWKEEMEQAQ